MDAKTSETMFSSKSGDWWTPQWVLSLAHDVLRGIDLDPATSVAANRHVNALRYYTEEVDGLAQDWYSPRLFLNPPYGRDIGLWTRKLTWEIEHEHVTQAIALLPARTDTRWFRELGARFSYCFLAGRLKFVSPDGAKMDPAPFPSVLVYAGKERNRFAAKAAEHGTIMTHTAL